MRTAGELPSVSLHKNSLYPALPERQAGEERCDAEEEIPEQEADAGPVAALFEEAEGIRHRRRKSSETAQKTGGDVETVRTDPGGKCPAAGHEPEEETADHIYRENPGRPGWPQPCGEERIKKPAAQGTQPAR